MGICDYVMCVCEYVLVCKCVWCVHECMLYVYECVWLYVMCVFFFPFFYNFICVTNLSHLPHFPFLITPHPLLLLLWNPSNKSLYLSSICLWPSKLRQVACMSFGEGLFTGAWTTCQCFTRREGDTPSSSDHQLPNSLKDGCSFQEVVLTDSVSYKPLRSESMSLKLCPPSRLCCCLFPFSGSYILCTSSSLIFFEPHTIKRNAKASWSLNPNWLSCLPYPMPTLSFSMS